MPFSSSPLTAERAPRSQSAPAGDVRLLATLEALILALLAAILGRRRTAAHWHALSPLDYVTDDEDLPYACLYPGESLFAPAPRPAYRLPCHTHQGIEHPLLYVVGPAPNRGMHAMPNRESVLHAVPARAPPPCPAATTHSPNPPPPRFTSVRLRPASR